MPVRSVHCDRCGKSGKEGGAFVLLPCPINRHEKAILCQECYAKLPVYAPEWHCGARGCDDLALPGDRFCPKCRDEWNAIAEWRLQRRHTTRILRPVGRTIGILVAIFLTAVVIVQVGLARGWWQPS